MYSHPTLQQAIELEDTHDFGKNSYTFTKGGWTYAILKAYPARPASSTATKNNKTVYLELGLKNTPLPRKTDDYFVSANFPVSTDLIRDDTPGFDSQNMKSTMNARHVRVEQFVQQHLGTSIPTCAEQYLADHDDTYEYKVVAARRSLCGHEDVAKAPNPPGIHRPSPPAAPLLASPPRRAAMPITSTPQPASPTPLLTPSTPQNPEPLHWNHDSTPSLSDPAPHLRPAS